MNFTDTLTRRRSVYVLNKDLPIEKAELAAIIARVTTLVPDAFNMRSQRLVVATGAKQEALWEAVYEAFDGKVGREKIDGFKAAYGTVLYYTNTTVVKRLQDQFPRYAENFPTWAAQSNGMLQFSIWSALAEVGIGANIQHYNPVIDEAVRKLFDLPVDWQLVAQMPFGGIAAQPDAKESEDISRRVRFFE